MSVSGRWGLPAAALGIVLLAAWQAAPAFAHHADVLVTADCSGELAYAVGSWAGSPNTPSRPRANELSRTVTDVRLDVSLDSGPFVTVAEHLALTPVNGYAVTGRVRLPGPMPSTLVARAVTVVPFANGARGDARRSAVVDLSDCKVSDEVDAQSARPADPDRRPQALLGGGVLGALATWATTRPKRRSP